MSRYDNTPRRWVPHSTQGWVQVTFRNPKVWRNQAYTDYQSSEPDDMILLAHQNYGDVERYWGIAEMNPDVLCPDDLVPGTILQIPAGPR